MSLDGDDGRRHFGSAPRLGLIDLVHDDDDVRFTLCASCTSAVHQKNAAIALFSEGPAFISNIQNFNKTCPID